MTGLELFVRRIDRGYVAWGFYAVTRLGDLLTTAYQLRREGYEPALEASPFPRLFMVLYGAAAGNLVHEAVILGLVIVGYILFLPARSRYGRLLEWAARRRMPLTGRVRPEVLSVIGRLSPNIIPFSAGIASAGAFVSNLLIIWRG